MPLVYSGFTCFAATTKQTSVLCPKSVHGSFYAEKPQDNVTFARIHLFYRKTTAAAGCC